MITTIQAMFDNLFDRDFILKTAKYVGAVDRVKTLHPADVVLALVCCAHGDEHRSIATARRQLLQLRGVVPEESSFYERLTPGLAVLEWLLFLRALAGANRAQRRQIARVLKMPVRDIRAVDATRVTLPARAAGELPSTDSKLGGFKLTATLSVLEDALVTVRFTDARQHDRKAFDLPAEFARILFLMDRGYADHRLFADIEDGDGQFIIRLKESSQPVIRTIRSGLTRKHRGQAMNRTLPFDGVVDLDASFSVRGAQCRLFRVVGIPVVVTKNGRSEPHYVWLATNLPADRVSADTVGTLYRLRWTIENFFRVLKTVGRLDQLQSGNRDIIMAFIAATLLAMVLAESLCALMREVRPTVEPSPHRVLAILIAQLPLLIAAHGPALQLQLESFVAALWREGLNPNPGRPYAWQQHIGSRR